MFKDEAISKAVNWNLRRCISPKRLLKIVKKVLLYKAKRSKYHDYKGFVYFWTYQRLSQEGFTELKDMCQKEGIIFSSNWESPFPENYCFKLKVR